MCSALPDTSVLLQMRSAARPVEAWVSTVGLAQPSALQYRQGIIPPVVPRRLALVKFNVKTDTGVVVGYEAYGRLVFLATMKPKPRQPPTIGRAPNAQTARSILITTPNRATHIKPVCLGNTRRPHQPALAIACATSAVLLRLRTLKTVTLATTTPSALRAAM